MRAIGRELSSSDVVAGHAEDLRTQLHRRQVIFVERPEAVLAAIGIGLVRAAEDQRGQRRLVVAVGHVVDDGVHRRPGVGAIEDALLAAFRITAAADPDDAVLVAVPARDDRVGAHRDDISAGVQVDVDHFGIVDHLAVLERTALQQHARLAAMRGPQYLGAGKGLVPAERDDLSRRAVVRGVADVIEPLAGKVVARREADEQMVAVDPAIIDDAPLTLLVAGEIGAAADDLQLAVLADRQDREHLLAARAYLGGDPLAVGRDARLIDHRELGKDLDRHGLVRPFRRWPRRQTGAGDQCECRRRQRQHESA